MFEGLVASVINKFLGDYVANLETKQLSIGIWQGDVVLHNLRLKKEALDKFNLPVDVLEGYMGDLTIYIPWNDLKNKPVKVFINNVYLLAHPKADSDYDPVLEEDRAHKLKMEKLETAEMLNAKDKLPGTDNKQNASFIAQLVTKIVDNLQITIKNIHIRYEDKVMKSSEHPLAVGITLSELSAVSTDENWNEAFIHEEVGVIHKSVRLGSLAAYWNTDSKSLAGLPTNEALEVFMRLIASEENHPGEHQYILKPVSGSGKLTMSKTYKEGQPRTHAMVEFDEFGFVLDDEQYLSIFSLMGSFSAYVRSQQFRKYRPPRTITPLIDPLAWFKYAGTCVLSEIHERNRKWTWAYFAERRDDRILYINLYKQSQSQAPTPLSPENSEMLRQLERKLLYNDIRFYRSIAKAQLKKEKASITTAAASKAPATTTIGWISDWWSGAPEKAAGTAAEKQDAPSLTDDQVQQLMETIEYDPSTAMDEPDIPKEAILLSIDWRLRMGSFALKRHSQRRTDLLSLVFESLDAKVTQHPSSIVGDLQLGNMTVTDGTTADNLYPIMVQPLKTSSRDAMENRPFFQMKFEHNPLDERADEALYLGMLPLQVIYNPAAISAIVDFFTPPAAEAATVSTLKSVAQDTLQGLTAQTRAGIEFAIGTHKTIDVKIDMAAPIFVFPESCNTLNSMVVVVDAGHLLVESNLVDKGVKSDIERKQGSELTDSEFAKLESLLYDRFTCSLTSVQAIVGRSVDACLLQVKTGSDTGLHLLERVDVTFQLELCILPKIARYPRTRITGNLPRLHINLSDRKYKTIMRILDIVSGKTSQRQAQRSAQQMQAKALEWTFQKNSSDLVLDESDDSFFDAEESLVATSSLSEKAPADSPDRISLKFSFEVGQVSASLKKSGKDSDAVEQALANLKIDGFSLQFRQRPFDMNVRIRIHSISIENEAGSGSGGPQYLVAPTSSESTADQELLLIEYTSVNRASPNFTGTDQTVDISFASIDVLLVKDSILGLYDFVLITFTGPPTPKEDVVEVDAAEESTEVSPTPKQGGSGVMVVRAKMKSINFIIIQNQTSIATLSFGAGQLSLTLKDSGTSIAGRLGNLSIVDNVARVGGGRLFKQLLRIDGSEVADFTLDTFNKASENYPGYDTSLRLRTSSVKLTFIEPLMVELMAYFREFTQLHFLLESARRAAVEETAGKFHFDLHLETPVIEFPDTSLTSQDVLSMYLGRISASNSFLVDSDGDKNEIIADIKELKLVSSFGSNVEVKLMEDVSIETKISLRDKAKESSPKTLVASELNEIVLKLDQHQYFFILNMLGSVSRAFGGDTEVKDDDDGTIGAESEDELALSTHSRSVDSQVSMDVNVVIPSISLELEKNNKTFGEQESIARFSVLSLQLRAVTLADTTLEAQLHAHSLRITDTRPNTGNLFREIMAETTGDNDQVCIRYAKNSVGIVNTLVSIDSIKLLLVLDHLFEIRNFFMQGNNADSNNQPSSPAKVSPQAVEVDRAEVNQLRVNLVGVEMILLHNALAEDTEAIILSAKELAYTSSVISTLSVSEMGMFFCVMTKREETTLRFIQNFDLTLVLDNRLTAPGHRMTNIYVDISPIMLRVSYRDVSLIRDVFNKVTELTSSDDKESKKVEEGVEQPAPSTIQDDIVMSREKIHVTTRGIRVLVIDDLNDVHLPMFNVAVDKLILEISDWSSTLRIDTGIKLHANYFNVKNSHWEPLVELFEVYLNVSRQEDAKMCIDVYVRKKLELNLSHVFVETSLNAVSLISKQNRVYVPRSNAHSPYILRNKTGYNMHVWAESLGDGLDTEVIDLQNDLEIPWRFDDWRAMRENVSPSPNKLSILIDGRGWEPLKGIAVDREGVKTYILREDSKRADRVAHRLVCEVRLKNNRKIVTFRSSTVVHNGTSIPIELMVLSVNGQKQSRVYALGADEECAIPIEASFKDKILVRPQEAFGYDWSTELLYWKDIQKQRSARLPFLISCSSLSGSSPPFRFQVNSVYPLEADKLGYPSLTLKLLAPFLLENLLPYDFFYSIFDNDSRQEHRGSLKSGEIDPIHTVDPTHRLCLSIQVPDTDFQPNEPAFLNNGEDYRDETIKLFDSEGLQLNLSIKYSDKLEFGGRKVTIFSPYVLLNKTGLDAVYSARSLIATSRLAAGQGKVKQKTNKPFMFSYTSFEPLRSRALVRFTDSEWSKPLSFEAVGSAFDVVIPSPSRNQEVHVGVTVKEGDGKYFLSKIVTFQPRFIIKNNMAEDVFCRQSPSTPTSLVKAGDYIPIVYFSESDQRQLSLRLTGLMDEWSSPFIINQIGQVFVKLSRMGSKSEDLLRAEVILEGATVFIVVSREEGRWPFRVDNQSDTNIHFWQKNSAARYLVNPKENRTYAWDNPSAMEKSLMVEVEGRQREIDIRGIGQLEPLKYPVPNDPSRTGVMSIRVFAEGPTLVVSLAPYIEAISQRQLIVAGRAATQTALKGKEPVKETVDNMVLQVRLEGIGISLISRDVKEILYASARKVDFIFRDTATTQDVSFRVGWLQIDNQQPGSLEPIFVYPTVLPKEGEELYHIMATLSKSKDSSYGVDYYNMFTILIQEISVDLDEDFLYALINFAKFDVSGWEVKERNFVDMDLSIPKSKFADGDTRMYFEKFLVQPMQFNISFQRTHSEKSEDARGVSSNVLTFFFDVFTMTVGNIHDAPIRLNALEMYHPIVTLSELVDLMMKFYSQEAVGQLHKIIGSADFLGNPVGLFNNVSSGVHDFFYKPIEGFEISRPQDFGIGLAKGTTSLFKKTVYGVTDTLSKFTGSVSKGLSVITLDEEFQESRRLNSVRNRPRHAGHGVTAGATSLVTSVASGLHGVLSKPIEGAEKDGIGGFFKGLGKGLVGVVSKPLIGVFDLATNVSEGIRNTTTVFDKELEKIRLPRHIGKDGILAPYDQREAQGSFWLRSINSGADEDYFAHLELNIEDLVVIVTDYRIIMIRWRSNRIDWEIPYKDLQIAQINNGGILLIQKGSQQAKARIIPCANRSSAQWIHNRIEIMLARSSSIIDS